MQRNGDLGDLFPAMRQLLGIGKAIAKKSVATRKARLAAEHPTLPQVSKRTALMLERARKREAIAEAKAAVAKVAAERLEAAVPRVAPAPPVPPTATSHG